LGGKFSLLATFFILLAVGTSVEFPWNVVAVILSSIIVGMLLIQNVPKFVKSYSAPRLDVYLFTYGSGRGEQKGVFQKDVQVRYDKKLSVLANSEIQIAIGIKPKWSYQINYIEIHGGGKSQIRLVEIFAKKRWWQEKGYIDMDGAYKFAPDISLRKKDITDPTIIDISITPPLKDGEKRQITIRISTKESRMPFTKDFELIGSVEPS